MRLLTTKALYRAFPELDHFSDEQCRTFVAAAKGDLVLRLFRLALQLIVALITLVLASVATSFIGRAFGASDFIGTNLGFFLFGVGMIVFAFGSAALAFLLSRDFLLRRRIRGVMQSRGSCHDCGYGLTGLPVITTPTAAGSNSHSITCPECGTPHVADASLGETIEDAKGTLRYVPSPNAPGRIRPGSLRRFIRHNTKLAAAIALFILLAVALPVGGYEFFLRRQAAEAKANILSATDLHALVAKTFPDLSTESSIDDLHPFERLKMLHSGMQSLQDQLSGPERSFVWPIDPEQTAFLAPPPEDPRYDAEMLARIRTDAEVGLDALVKDGAFDQLDAIAAMPPRVPLLAIAGPILSLYTSFNGQQGSVSALLALNRARIRRAILDNDAAAAATALRTHLRLINHMATVPVHNAQYTTQTEHFGAIVLASHAIFRNRTNPSREAFSALLDALRESPHFPTQAQLLDIDAAVARSTVAFVFADPSNVRFGTRSFFISQVVDRQTPISVGTYTKSIEELESILAARTAAAGKDRFERPVPNVPAPRYAATLFADNYASVWLEFTDTHTALTRAVPLFLAIEQFLFDNNRLPTTLDELIPRYIAAIPIDPFSGKPLLYKISPPGTDPNIPNTYAIYSTGPDQVDHGATFPPMDRFNRVLKPQFPDTPLITMPPQAPQRN
jgi:hypothetical protein